MKRFTIIFLIMVLAVGFAFADSVKSTTTYDADAETLKEEIKTSIALGGLTIKNDFTFADVLAEEVDIDWDAELALALNEAISLGMKSGIDSKVAEGVRTDVVPLEFSASWTVFDGFKVSGKYAHDDLNAEEPEIGTFTLTGELTF